MKEKIAGTTFDRVPVELNTVKDNIASLAKGLYDNMFNWLVIKMNQEILPTALKTEMNLDQFAEETQTVGLLDIFGFENFKLN